MNEQPALNSSDEAVGSAGEQKDRLAELRAAVEQGIDDIRAGRVVDLDSAFDRIEAMLDEIESAERR